MSKPTNHRQKNQRSRSQSPLATLKDYAARSAKQNGPNKNTHKGCV
ncbi:hypothetical protein H6F77_21330 [Microcoleus sp. FACHB-831]|nr:hypothetical protein [Microcoleus sp. FACHB-831]MBD1923595.1 hypothetical protein [Microcoleus sp. FACHB-831]